MSDWSSRYVELRLARTFFWGPLNFELTRFDCIYKCWHTSWKFQLEITRNKSPKSLWQTYMKWTVPLCIDSSSPEALSIAYKLWSFISIASVELKQMQNKEVWWGIVWWTDTQTDRQTTKKWSLSVISAYSRWHRNDVMIQIQVNTSTPHPHLCNEQLAL